MVPPPAMPATSAPSYGAAQHAAPRMASAKANGWAGPYTGGARLKGKLLGFK